MNLARFKVRLDVDPRGEGQQLKIRVVLPNSGRLTWPAADALVVDPAGKALLVRRSGIEWHRLLFRVPAVSDQYFVQTVNPQRPEPLRLHDRARVATDSVTRLEARVWQWHDGRRAALCPRFDDSHPTHLSKVIPILREYRLRGAFTIDPGRPAFLEHKAEWEVVARRGDQEFANHTMHHRGARGDEEPEREIGDAAYIQSLFRNRSKLIALNLGGGTRWETTRPMRYFLEKYHLFDASSGSLGIDDSYGNRVEAFRRHTERHVQRGGWCRAHYHYIGKGFNTSEENFLAALTIAKQHAGDLWIMGLADAHEYRRERCSARLALKGEVSARARLTGTAGTDPALYDQPLTLEICFPQTRPPDEVHVTDSASNPVTIRPTRVSGGVVICFDAASIGASYIIEGERQKME